MPELPEVETTIRYLKPIMLDKVIEDMTVSNKGESHFNKDFDEIRHQLVGHKLFDLSRIGKWMLFDFNAVKAVGHLRMSGRYDISDNVVDHPHNRFQLHLAGNITVNYIDQRRFGTFDLVNNFDEHRSLQKLGPDALSSEDLSVDYLLARFAQTSRPVYTTLLDQAIIAGLGNIYVNEVLHSCGIHPLQPANTISKSKVAQLIGEIQGILQVALRFKGTTLIDNLYRDPEGNNGEFARMLKVYGKKEDPNISVLKVAGRSVYVHHNTKLQT